MPRGIYLHPRRPLTARFWSRVEFSPHCWVWVGPTNDKGYGQIRVGGRGSRCLLVHRLSWELHYGPIPPGMCVLHHCDNPPCVRPDHLFLGTLADNNRDMYRKGRDNNGQRAKLFCPRGHPYSGANLYMHPNGSRNCRTCHRERMRLWRPKSGGVKSASLE